MGNPRTLAAWHEQLPACSKDAALARTAKDIRDICSSGRIAVTFAWQSADGLAMPELNDWTTKPPKTCLRAYYELGLRVINLTYNVANQFAGGCLDPAIGLSRQGQWLVTAMQDMGILVDCGGHMGEQSSLDVIKIASRPVVCTHSNVLALNDNPRNTSDRVIEGIARTGGLFAVTAINAFMTWNDSCNAQGRAAVPLANVARYVDELDYLKRLVGVDHIGFGFDYTHGASAAMLDPANSFLFPPDMTYPMFDTIEYAEGLEDITCFGSILAEMRARGWAEQDIAKCAGGNWMRVYADAWGA